MQGVRSGRGAVEQWVDHPILARLIGRPPVLLSRQILRNWKSQRGWWKPSEGAFGLESGVWRVTRIVAHSIRRMGW